MTSTHLNPRLITCMLVCALTTGCSDADAENGAREVLSDGSEIITYTDLSGAPLDTLSADLAIGEESGEEWETFGSIAGIAVDENGAIHVLDFQARAVRIFEADGRYRTTMGRAGDGPGEFRQPRGLMSGPDGSLWVRDLGSRRVMVMSRDGREVNTYAFPGTGRAITEWEAVIDEQGRFWQSWIHEPGDGPVQEILTGLSEVPRHVYARSVEPGSGAADSTLTASSTARFVRWQQAPGYASAGVPFDPQPVMAINATGHLWTASTQTYRIQRLARPGTAPLTIQVTTEGPRIADQQRTNWKGLMNRAQANIEVPERYPALRRILVDDRNLLWVQRRTAADDLAHLAAFDSTGRLLGSIRLAAQPLIRPVIRGGHVYAVTLTEQDVPQVVRAALPQWAQ